MTKHKPTPDAETAMAERQVIIAASRIIRDAAVKIREIGGAAFDDDLPGRLDDIAAGIARLGTEH